MPAPETAGAALTPAHAGAGGGPASFVDPLRTTASAVLSGPLADGPVRRAAQLAGEACAYTGLSCVLLLALGLADAGLLSIFLVAAPLSDRLALLLEENRSGIYVLHRSRRRANQRTAAGLLWLFVGIAIGYTAVAVWLGERGTLRVFAFAVEAANLGGETLLRRSFGAPLGVLVENLRVGLVVLALGFVYRGYGGMLALTWNACVWSTVLTVLLGRAGSGSLLTRALLAAGLLPHLVLEAGAYVCLALAAIFASKALATYERGDPRLSSAVAASALLVGAAIAGLAGAAVCEAWLWPAWMTLLVPR